MGEEEEEELSGANDADRPLDAGDVILSDTLLDEDDREFEGHEFFELNSSRFPPSLGPCDSDRAIGPFVFEKTDFARLNSPTAILNDICINGLAYYLRAMLSNDQRYQTSSAECAVFSTHDLVRIRYKASDQDL
ncbi:hypothetical protein CVT26_005960 [Gymnopilus dilepis]|uniref:Uncharacterized protein n=1 Tax=Gymnopilus dilepis TaxID=231916 RepID=A0A409Y1R2_9AGAR|nr:hypothetical protein CVT26_005960 [Gymnopilus dilepis]